MKEKIPAHVLNDKIKAQLKILKSKYYYRPLCLKKRGEIRKISYQALNQKWAILIHIQSCSFREISVENKIVKKSSFVPTWLRKTFERKMLHSHFCTILFFAHFALFERYLLRGLYCTILLRIFFSPQVHGWLNALTDAFIRYFAEIAWFCTMRPLQFHKLICY